MFNSLLDGCARQMPLPNVRRGLYDRGMAILKVGSAKCCACATCAYVSTGCVECLACLAGDAGVWNQAK
eukprot:582123-Amphidinium_carterae.1